jgi:SAM-dependent methyltransferase
MLDDLRWGIRLQGGYIETDSGATHAELSDEDSVRYIEEVFTDYKRYGKIERLNGIAAEIGPGDNVGVAMLMRQDGCHQVDLVDRYESRRDPQQQDRIYDVLSKKYGLEWLRPGQSWNDRQISGIVPRIGQSAEQYFEKCAQNRGPIYDLIVSRSVLEHLYDPLDALDQMILCLKPGGCMFHKIDLRDHGLFAPQHHELTFLTFPTIIYRWMTRNSGRPNRVLFHRYRERLERLKEKGLIDYSIYVTRLTGVGDIIPHQRYEDVTAAVWRQATQSLEQCRSRFAYEFLHVKSRDLAVGGVFLTILRR